VSKSILLSKFAIRSESSLAAPYEGWSVNILPARSAAVALPRNEVEAHALFACDVGAATGAGAGF
jgi:hypothetical protein